MTWLLLRDGLRLAFLLRPRTVPECHSARPILILLLLQAIASLPAAWLLSEPPRMFEPAGLAYPLVSLALTLLAATGLATGMRRTGLTLTLAGWLLAASLPGWLAISLALRFAPDEADWPVFWVTGAAWAAMVLARILATIGPINARSLLGTVAALLLAVLPWWVVETPDFIATDWSDWVDDDAPAARLPFPERTLYAQSALLDASLRALAPQRPGHVDLYTIGFAGDADERAFRNEVDFLVQLGIHRFDAAGRSVRLINQVDTATTVPLATVTNLERALAGVAERMDPDEDILLLYLSSHGSEDHMLYVNQPPLPLRQLGPQRLRRALDEAGIRWRVIVVSACYSGGFIDPLAGPETLVITAAAADRTSFGCGNSADATWFGESFLVDGLNHTADFRLAFLQALESIAARERAQGYEASEPQWSMGEAVAAQLSQWRDALPPGRATAFVPNAPVASRRATDATPALSPDEPAAPAE